MNKATTPAILYLTRDHLAELATARLAYPLDGTEPQPSPPATLDFIARLLAAIDSGTNYSVVSSNQRANIPESLHFQVGPNKPSA